MTEIHLTTLINAPIEKVFDLSRSVDLHMISTQHTHETVVEGRTSGLFEVGERVTWRAKHFGIYQQLTVKIVHCDFPFYFEDRLVKGAFKSFVHKHHFKFEDAVTTMRDTFGFVAPLGIFGALVTRLILERYMTSLLTKRNEVIRSYSESPQGDALLSWEGTVSN